MVQNNINTDKHSIKIREDLGWVNLKKQLDIELPQKKKNRRILWFFVLGIGLISGFGLLRSFTAIPIPQSPLPVGEPVLPSSAQEQIMDEVATTDKINRSTIQTDPSTINLQEKNTVNAIITDPGISNSTIINPGSSSSNKSTASGYTPHNQASSVVPDQIKNSKDKLSASSNKKVSSPTSRLDQYNIETKDNMVDPASIVFRPDRMTIDLMPNLPLGVFSSTLTELKIPLLGSYMSPIILSRDTNNSLNFFLQGGVGRLSGQRWNSSILAGIPVDLGKKFYMTFQGGLAYQYANKSILATGRDQSSAQSAIPGASKQLDNGSTYSVNATKIFIDPTNSFTGFRQDSLFVAAGDQVTYRATAQWMGILKAGLGFRLFPRLFIESGIDFRHRLDKVQDKLLVQYTSPVNNGFSSSGLDYSTFTFDQSVGKNRTSLYVQGGYKLNNRLSLNFALTTRPIKNIGKSILFANADLSAGSGARKVFIEDTKQPYILDLTLRYSFGR